MTNQEIVTVLETARMQSAVDCKAVIEVARGLVPALYDLGLAHSARELERVLGVHDAHTQERHEWVVANMTELTDATIEVFRGSRR